MIFRSAKGEIVDIRRSSYASDTSYYRDIMRIKGITIDTKQDIIGEIRSLIKRQK